MVSHLLTKDTVEDLSCLHSFTIISRAAVGILLGWVRFSALPGVHLGGALQGCVITLFKYSKFSPTLPTILSSSSAAA